MSLAIFHKHFSFPPSCCPHSARDSPMFFHTDLPLPGCALMTHSSAVFLAAVIPQQPRADLPCPPSPPWLFPATSVCPAARAPGLCGSLPALVACIMLGMPPLASSDALGPLGGPRGAGPPLGALRPRCPGGLPPPAGWAPAAVGFSLGATPPFRPGRLALPSFVVSSVWSFSVCFSSRCVPRLSFISRCTPRSHPPWRPPCCQYFSCSLPVLPAPPSGFG